ncbi:hypothetical protein CcaverHIS002_0510200 [Cutaneotrichosporon cavernicola]|nr:hypothetical protein CcaverHIS002_0510200 [Cutaneotrichosporon cavernicola]
MPPPNNRPSPNPIQSHHGHSTHSHASSHDHSHHSGADSGRSGRSVASSVTGAFESSTSEGFPVHDLLGGSGSSTSSSLLQSLPSTGVAPRRRTGDSGTPFQLTAGPLVMEPQQADFGFGLGPPDPWEALLQNTMVPNFWTEPNVPETSFDFDSLLQHGPMRPQESAERHGSGGRAGASVGGNEDMLDVGDVLLERLNNSYPDLSLTAPDLTEALELHWSLVAPSFPFIHRGTFDVDTAATELVVMMVVTGAVHSDRPRRDDGKLVRTVRSNLLKDHCGLDMQLSALQAYTLCHVFDTWYSDTESLFVAQCLHPKFQVNVIHEGYSSAVLSALAAESASSKVDTDNVFAVSLVLTGLLAIAWDCRTRGGLGLRFRDGSKHWRSIVLNAVVNLRAEHEVATAHLPPSVENRDLRDSIAIGIISILSDIPMLQVAAGSTSVCGATIGLTQFTDAERRLKLWAPTPDAWTCLWQSTRYLRDALFFRLGYVHSLGRVPHYAGRVGLRLGGPTAR